MKSFMLSFAIFSILAITTSCTTSLDDPSPRALDKITIMDKKDNVQQEYVFDKIANSFVGENTEKRITIKGTVESVEPNNDGGHNYRCVTSDEICYDKK